MNGRHPDVFISYSSKDREWVSGLAQAIKSSNYKIWWDQELIGGQNFHRDISQALSEAGCVVVVWSENSVESSWVQGEADQANDRGALIPIAYNSTHAPTAFRSLHTIDFNSWNGHPTDYCFQNLLKSIEYKISNSHQKTEEIDSQGFIRNIKKDYNKKKGCSFSIMITLSVLITPFLFFYKYGDELRGDSEVLVEREPEKLANKEQLETKVGAEKLIAEGENSEELIAKRGNSDAILFKMLLSLGYDIFKDLDSEISLKEILKKVSQLSEKWPDEFSDQKIMTEGAVANIKMSIKSKSYEYIRLIPELCKFPEEIVSDNFDMMEKESRVNPRVIKIVKYHVSMYCQEKATLTTESVVVDFENNLRSASHN